MTEIEIGLTDFGMADSDSKGGSPVYASPECFEKTDKKSDIFSFGRVILFLLLTKNQFMKWLFIPIRNKARILRTGFQLTRQLDVFRTITLVFAVTKTQFESDLFFYCEKSGYKADTSSLSSIIAKNSGTPLQLVSQMTSVSSRIDLKSVIQIFGRLKTNFKIKLPGDLTNSIDSIISNNMTVGMEEYVDDLSEIR